MTQSDAPLPGDIWSSRYHDRRVKVLHVWPSGRIQVRGVIPAGNDWKFSATANSVSVDGDRFPKVYRLIARNG